jgi:NAD(P)-dependent dehydrogenase (short-subunit alcohol dehydrogenase family)
MAKRIIITGATRGLGRALVPHFAQVKHIVAGCGRSGSAIAELKSKYTAPHHFAIVDVRDCAAMTEWASQAMTAMGGPPDLVICNAALMNDPQPLWKIPSRDFDAVIDVNVKGVANTIRAFAPAMVARKVGVIIALSSGWGRSTSPEVAPYCASKYAIEGMMMALAQELPAGMASIPLNPGVIDTDMLRQCWKEKASTFPKADAWAKRAAPYLLTLSVKENGRSISVPASTV